MYSIENQYMKGQNKLFFAIIIALVLGVIIGGVVHTQFPENTESFSKNIKLLGDKVRLAVLDDEKSQEMAYLSLGVGLGEMNSRGAGFVNYRWL